MCSVSGGRHHHSDHTRRLSQCDYEVCLQSAYCGVEEVTEQLLLYITFMGTAWLLKKEGHVAVDFVLLRMRPKTRSFFGIVSCLIGILICAALTWYGFKVTWVNLRQGAYFSSVLELPKAPVFVIIPIEVIAVHSIY
jgi:TRAP-type C4-dicarboxylate transport system permease small subunit